MTIKIMTISDYENIYSLWMNTPNMGLNNLDDSKEGNVRFMRGDGANQGADRCRV